MAENITYTIAGHNLQSEFGVRVSKASGLLDLPKFKAPKSRDWEDEHGEEMDLDNLRVEPRDITLECFIVAYDNETLCEKITNLQNLLTEAGTSALVVNIGSQSSTITRNVYLADEIAIDKKFIKPDETEAIVGTFKIRLREPDPIANDDDEPIIVIEHPDGTQLSLPDEETAAIVKSARQSRILIGADTVEVTIESAEKIDFFIGDTITVYGSSYTLNELPHIDKKADQRLEYRLTFEGMQYELIDAMFILSVQSVSDAYTATLEQILTQLVASANRVHGTGRWLFEVEDDEERFEEYKTLNYTGQNCLAALQSICQEYDTEFKVQLTQAGGRKIVVGKAGDVLPDEFMYGRGKGLYNLQRTSVSGEGIVTRLFAYGSTANLPEDEPYSRLLLPSATGRTDSYVEDEDAQAIYGVKESVKNYDDIKPERTGTITGRTGCAYNEFIDTGMDFDLNETDGGNTKWLIKGVTAKITMQTGNLAGYVFELNKYDHATKKFTVVPFTDENNYAIPSQTSTAFAFVVGDKYIISDIRMPDAYVEDARDRLEAKALEDLNASKHPKVQYSLGVDRMYLKKRSGGTPADIFKLGDYVHIVDADLSVDENFRITAYTRDILDPFDYTLTLGETVSVSMLTRIVQDAKETQRILQINDITDARKARSYWQIQQELLQQVFDTDGYFDPEKIKPLSIETGMLSVGSRSQQLLLNGVTIEANYQNNAAKVHVTGGSLTNYGIGESPTTWQIDGSDITNLNASKSYYIYARVDKTNTQQHGSVIVTDTQYRFDQDGTYYHFLLGTLSTPRSANDGTTYRIISLTYGATTINGKYIRTGVIQSSAGGASYWDIDNNKWFIGDSNQSIDFGVTAAGQLTLHNVKLLSTSGDTSNIGIYRGSYNQTFTYYEGDEVSYTADGETATYRCLQQTTGHAPTDATYWEPIAKGKKGTDGTSFRTKGTATDSQTAPASPILGQFWYNTSTSPATIRRWNGSTWESVTINEGDAYKLESNNHLMCWTGTSWTDLGSIKGTDGTDGDDGYNGTTILLFQRASSAPSKPSNELTYTFSTGAITGTLGSWQTSIPTTNGSPCWVTKISISSRNNAVTIQPSQWSTPSKMVEDGQSPYTFDVNNEMGGVLTGADGKVTQTQTVQTRAYLYKGQDIQMLSADDITVPTDSTYRTFVVSQSGDNVIVTITYLAGYQFPSGTTETIQITATIGGTAYGKTLAISPVKDGKQYRIIPSTSSINISKASTFTIACAVTLNGERQSIGSSGQIGGDSSVILKYRMSGDVWGVMANGSKTFSDSETSFEIGIFKTGNNAPLDYESIAFVEDGDTGEDGESEEYIELEDYFVPVQTEADGSTTTENLEKLIEGIRLMYGQTPVPLTQSMCSIQPTGRIASFSRITQTDASVFFELPAGQSLQDQGKDYTVTLGGTLNGVTHQRSIVIHVVPSIQGNAGDSFAAIFRGEYSATETYYGNATRRDIVKYGGIYYIAKKVSAGYFTNKLPTNTAYWTTFGAQFESIATGLLLAENANIAGFIFRNLRLESQKTLDDGVTPMVVIDGIGGYIKFGANMTITEDTVEISQNGEVVTRVVAGSVGDESSLSRQKSGEEREALSGTITQYQGRTASIRWIHPFDANIWKISLGNLKVGDVVRLNEAYFMYFIPYTSKGEEMTTRMTMKFVISKDNHATPTPPYYPQELHTLDYNDTSKWSGDQAMAYYSGTKAIRITEDATYYLYAYITLGQFTKAYDFFEIGETVPPPDVSAMIRFDVIVPNQTVVGNDGIATCWGQNKFLIAKGDGVRIRFGNYGLKVDETGVYKMTNGSSWVQI